MKNHLHLWLFLKLISILQTFGLKKVPTIYTCVINNHTMIISFCHLTFKGACAIEYSRRIPMWLMKKMRKSCVQLFCYL